VYVLMSVPHDPAGTRYQPVYPPTRKKGSPFFLKASRGSYDIYLTQNLGFSFVSKIVWSAVLHNCSSLPALQPTMDGTHRSVHMFLVHFSVLCC
jgi:hypothetical protein